MLQPNFIAGRSVKIPAECFNRLLFINFNDFEAVSKVSFEVSIMASTFSISWLTFSLISINLCASSRASVDVYCKSRRRNFNSFMAGTRLKMSSKKPTDKIMATIIMITSRVESISTPLKYYNIPGFMSTKIFTF